MWYRVETTTLRAMISISTWTRPSRFRTSEAFAIGIEKQMAISALAHLVAEPAEADGWVAQIVGLPAAIRNALGTEQDSGDFAIASSCHAPV